MKIVKILKNDIKLFMNQLFIQNTFHEFCVRRFEVETFVKCEVDGYNKEYENNYVLWQDLQFLPKGIIKEKNLKPNTFTLEFIFLGVKLEAFPKLKNALLILNYDGEEVMITTSATLKEFSLDRTHEAVWFEYIIKVLKDKGIEYVVDEI